MPAEFNSDWLAFSLSFWRYSNRFPCSWFVPDFVTIVTIPPPVRPYCASYVFDRTRNSWTDSICGTWITVRFERTLLIPSRRTSFSWLFPPLIAKPDVPPISNDRRYRQLPLFTMPGADHAS